ncbi:hypothetical protein [Flavobacterium daejeonense]|uniref:hypothetical protein n=1 Tax=Flavobacterium daejeonense TaxID=350893 RepID=UPI00047B9599|nr:hypothetical protein [Flavobacterium daejeonense]
MSGAVVGVAGGLVGGFTTGFGNSLVDGKNIGDSFKYGIQGGALGAITGGIVGGAVGGIQALKEGTNFWTGEGTSEYSNTLSLNDSREGLSYSNESARNFSNSHEELNRLSQNVDGLHADGSYPKGYSSINGQISGPNGYVHGVTAKTGVFKKTIDVYLSKSAFVSRPQLYMTMHHEYMHAYFFVNNISVINGGHDIIHNWHYAQATKWGIPVNVRTTYFSKAYYGLFDTYSKYGFKVINNIP